MTTRLFSFLLILLFSCTEESDILVKHLAERDFDVILVIGQSNTHFGRDLDPAMDASDPRVFQLGRFGVENNIVVEGSEPLQHHTQQSNKIGFALSFGKQYVQDFLASDGERNVLLIPGGAGGSGFSGNRWNKGDDLYEDAVQRTQFVLETFPNSRLVAILWHQGEADVGSSTYQTDLDQFISDLLNDIAAEDVPFILGGMVPYWVNQAAERLTQQNIIKDTGNRLPLIGYADPSLPWVLTKPDNTFDMIHFDAKGQRELACRYFWEYERLVE